MIYVRFNTGNIWFQDAKWFDCIESASSYARKNGYKSILSISKSDGVKKNYTSFEPGYNIALGKYIKTRDEYKKELKDRGLIEIGNENLPRCQQPKSAPYLTDDVAKEIVAMGGEIDESTVREVNAGNTLDTSTN